MKNLPIAVVVTPVVLLVVGFTLYATGNAQYLEGFPRIFYVIPGLAVAIPGALFTIYFLVFKKDQEALLDSMVLFSVGAMIAWLNPLFGALAVGIMAWRKFEARRGGSGPAKD